MPKAIIISNGAVSSEESVKRNGGGQNYHNNKNKKNSLKKRYRLLIIVAVIILILAGLLKYLEARMRPIITSMAEAHARSIASMVVSEAINEEIEINNISYDDLISFEKDENGRIAALKTDIIIVNRLKSSLSVAILNKLLKLDDIDLYIPVGNLINGEIFAGRGPKIKIIVIPIGSVTTNITNVFTAAGINQTRHQIMLEVCTTVSVIMPFSVASTDITVSVAVAETIIVGEVPNVYVQTETGSEIMKIFE